MYPKKCWITHIETSWKYFHIIVTRNKKCKLQETIWSTENINYILYILLYFYKARYWYLQIQCYSHKKCVKIFFYKRYCRIWKNQMQNLFCHTTILGMLRYNVSRSRAQRFFISYYIDNTTIKTTFEILWPLDLDQYKKVLLLYPMKLKCLNE